MGTLVSFVSVFQGHYEVLQQDTYHLFSKERLLKVTQCPLRGVISRRCMLGSVKFTVSASQQDLDEHPWTLRLFIWVWDWVGWPRG